MEVVGIVIATVVAFVISFVFYAVVPAPSGGAAEQARPKAWQIVVELGRSAVTAVLLTGLLAVGGWTGAGRGALLGVAIWALPVVLLTGSVIWEGVPVRNAALHAGDWLIKLAAVGAITGAFA